MKFILVIVAVLALLWLLRRSVRSVTRAPRAGSASSGEGSAQVQPMLTCAHCGTHLPREDALPGRGGVFCDAAHRAAYENAHPAS
jgi:uncharacterized protein